MTRGKLTPQNAALLLIDYQPAQVASVRSTDHELLVKNAVSTVRTIKAFDVPVVHSTVNVASGQGQPTIPELAGLLENDRPLDRTTVNSWKTPRSLRPAGRPAQEADLLRSLDRGLHGLYRSRRAARGYEVYPIVDAIGGTSLEAHRAGLERVVQAGGQPINWVSLACELQLDQERVACLRPCAAATI